MQRVENVISQQGNNLSDLVNRYAEIEQCPAVGLLAGLISESNLNEHAERIGSWPDWSEGLGQQTALYAAVGDHSATMANLKVVRDYYWQPEHAIAEAARQYGAYYRQYQDHFEAWSRYNGGPALAWADNPNQANIRRGWTAAQLYLAAEEEPAPMHYDPDTEAVRQPNDWTCSVATATFLRNSVGDMIGVQDMQAQMVAAGLVSATDGLADGTGMNLERWLHFQTGLDTLGRQAITWEQLCALAGQGALGMGSGTLYHWLAVRRLNDDGTLQLMNPAPGYRGVGEVLDRATFEQWAPWNAIWLVTEEDDLSAEERAELTKLRKDRVEYYDTLLGTDDNPGGLIGSALGTMEEATGTSKTHLAKVVREQCSSVRKAAGL